MKVALSAVQPGMVLAEDIRIDRRVYYHRGERISKSDLKVLKSLRVKSLHIDENADKPESREGFLSDKLREEAVAEVRRTYLDFHLITPRRFDAIRTVGEKIVDEILSQNTFNFSSMALRTYDDYTFHHSVNVTSVSVALGSQMGLPERELKGLAAGALMHDIGKMRIPELILQKNGRLEPTERDFINRHPEWGFDILSEQTASDPVIWGVAHQHHEAMDGSGYPNAKTGRNIHPWARIVMVADIWDALRSDRPYKPAWSVGDTFGYMNSAEMTKKLDPEALNAMNQMIAVEDTCMSE